ncbi:MAG: hypothetical protein IJ899_07185 [Blautia sp.]|nr:hypothetical protein [Blautia sp.]
MKTTLKAKNTSSGFVELVQDGDTYYIYIDGRIKSYSKDLMFMMKEFDNIY